MRITPYLAAIPLLTLPAFLGAEEAVAPIVPADAPWWVQLVVPILTAVVVPFLVAYLRKKNQEAAAEAEKTQLDSTKSLLEQKNLLIDKRVIPFLWNSAEHLAATQLPVLLKDATDGDGKFDWKAHLNSIKDELLDLAKDKFAQEGIDLIQVLGAKYLGQLVDRAIAKAIPWLPNVMEEQAAKIAEGKGEVIVSLILSKGLQFANKRWLNGQLDLSGKSEK